MGFLRKKSYFYVDFRYPYYIIIISSVVQFRLPVSRFVWCQKYYFYKIFVSYKYPCHVKGTPWDETFSMLSLLKI